MLIEELNDRKRFTKAEQEVVSYILDNPQKVTKLTIEQLATVTFSSNSSIVRVCKKVGTKGFSDFKIQLAREMSSFVTDGVRVEADIPIEPGDHGEAIAKRIATLQYQALAEAYNGIDMEEIGRAAEMIDKSDIVYMYGKGESLLALSSFAADLRRIGKLSKCETFAGFERVYQYYGRTKLRSCAEVLSQFADSRVLMPHLRALREENIPIIMIHGNQKSILVKNAACSICFNNSETNSKFGSFASRIVKQYILDVLYSAVFSLHYEENVKLVHQYADKVLDRKRFVDGVRPQELCTSSLQASSPSCIWGKREL